MKEVVINLDNPSGLAIHPKTGQVFIASHDGVHRFVPGEVPLKCPLEITGFPTDVYGKGPKYDISALGVAFLDDEHLVVGDGSRVDGEELVRVFKIPEKHPGKPQKEDESVYTAGPIGASEESVMGEGNYYGVAVLDGVVYVTNNGDDTKGWISSFSIADGKATKLTPVIATKVATNVDAPVPIAVLDGKLYVGQMGEVTTPGDSLLTVYDPENYDPKDPKPEKKWETGLSDIAGLAYSPKTKKWYCTDFAWAEPENGGLFELTVADDKVTAKKLAKLDKPTALTFDKDGNLYVAVFGTGKPDDAMTPGKLLMIEAAQLK
jgi:glucose/arabinose dehydrogenase